MEEQPKTIEIELPSGVSVERLLKFAQELKTRDYKPAWVNPVGTVPLDNLLYKLGVRDYFVTTSTHKYFEGGPVEASFEEMQEILREKHPNSYDEAAIVSVEECQCPGCQRRKERESMMKVDFSEVTKND